MIKLSLIAISLLLSSNVIAQTPPPLIEEFFEFSLSGDNLGDPIFLQFEGSHGCFLLSDYEINRFDEVVSDPDAPFGKRQNVIIDILDTIHPAHPGCDGLVFGTWQIEAGVLRAPTLSVLFRYCVPSPVNPQEILEWDVIEQEFQLLHSPGANLNLDNLTTLDEALVTFYSNCQSAGTFRLDRPDIFLHSHCTESVENDDWQITDIRLPRLQADPVNLTVLSYVSQSVSSNLFDIFNEPGHTQWTRFDIDVRHAVPAEASGLWYTEDNPGTGLTILVLDDTRIIAIWYTLDPDGNLVWIYGDGTVQPPTTPDTLDVTVQFDAFLSDGPQANPMALKNRNDLSDWGSWTMVFSACDAAQFNWQPNQSDWTAGEAIITQLAGTMLKDCASRR